jgi:hypothetical protein
MCAPASAARSTAPTQPAGGAGDDRDAAQAEQIKDVGGGGHIDLSSYLGRQRTVGTAVIADHACERDLTIGVRRGSGSVWKRHRGVDMCRSLQNSSVHEGFGDQDDFHVLAARAAAGRGAVSKGDFSDEEVRPRVRVGGHGLAADHSPAWSTRSCPAAESPGQRIEIDPAGVGKQTDDGHRATEAARWRRASRPGWILKPQPTRSG